MSLDTAQTGRTERSAPPPRRQGVHLDNLESGVEFRRARLYMSGTIYKNVFFKAQYDFADGDARFKDVYVGVKKIPIIGHIKIGNFKEPFSLEELTSSKYITFMERSVATSAFAPSRHHGVMAYNTVPGTDDRATWAVGMFRNSDGYGRTRDGEAIKRRVQLE